MNKFLGTTFLLFRDQVWGIDLQGKFRQGTLLCKHESFYVIGVPTDNPEGEYAKLFFAIPKATELFGRIPRRIIAAILIKLGTCLLKWGKYLSEGKPT